MRVQNVFAKEEGAIRVKSEVEMGIQTRNGPEYDIATLPDRQ